MSTSPVSTSSAANSSSNTIDATTSATSGTSTSSAAAAGLGSTASSLSSVGAGRTTPYVPFASPLLGSNHGSAWTQSIFSTASSSAATTSAVTTTAASPAASSASASVSVSTSTTHSAQQSQNSTASAAATSSTQSSSSAQPAAQTQQLPPLQGSQKQQPPVPPPAPAPERGLIMTILSAIGGGLSWFFCGIWNGIRSCLAGCLRCICCGGRRVGPPAGERRGPTAGPRTQPRPGVTPPLLKIDDAGRASALAFLEKFKEPREGVTSEGEEFSKAYDALPASVRAAWVEAVGRSGRFNTEISVATSRQYDEKKEGGASVQHTQEQLRTGCRNFIKGTYTFEQAKTYKEVRLLLASVIERSVN